MDARTERFRRLLEPVHDRVLTFARGLCKSSSDGDDLFQESALRALWRRRRELRRIASASSSA